MFDPILLVLLAMLAGALYLAFSVISQAKSGTSRRRKSRPKPKYKSNLQTRNNQKVNASTRRKLLTMLQGDEEAAFRLIQRTEYTHPDKSEQWRWEKVIWDLERDRRV